MNYVTPPSDSLLGVFCGIEQLLGRSTPSSPPIKDAVLAGQAILANHRTDLATQVRHLLNQLSFATFETVQGTVTCPLFDAQKNKSTATDTRRERMRFVVNANIWSTLAKAIELDVVAPREIEKSFGCDMATYKEHILDLFGGEGFIRNSVDPDYPAAGIHAITLDFAHINRGFWDFSSSREISLFKNTSAMIMNSDLFKDISRECFFVSAKNAPAGLIDRIAVPSYHGRTVWPALNVEFVDRLLDLSRATGDDDYFAQAAMTLRQIGTMSKQQAAIRNSSTAGKLTEHGSIECYRRFMVPPLRFGLEQSIRHDAYLNVRIEKICHSLKRTTGGANGAHSRRTHRSSAARALPHCSLQSRGMSYGRAAFISRMKPT